nr:immunoglobulin heavy chain junction region [Macaca mulatta]
CARRTLRLGHNFDYW